MGRKAWLFVGSDGHAVCAGNLLGPVVPTGLHRLSRRAYLRDFFRVLPRWPRDRRQELAPKCWAKVRARLAPRELAAEIGRLTGPRPAAPHEEEAAANRPPCRC